MKQQEKRILIKEIYEGLGINTSVESVEIKAFDIYAEQQTKELKEEVRELTNRYIKEVKNGSRSREELFNLRLSIEPTETIIRGFANLFDGYVKNQHVEQQIKELKEKAEEIVETYILTTPTDKESGATMVVSKLAQPIIEMNELLNKY